LQQQSLLAGQFTSALAATDVNGTSSFGSAAAPLTNNGGAAVDSTMPSLEMSTPFKQAGWDKELGDRVMWMIKQDVKVAELKINPPQLGPLEMRVSVNQDQASVVFHSNHQMARDALEAAIPRLREMLADAGLNLADANVSSQSSSDQEQGYQSAAGNSNGGNGGYHDSASPEDSVEHTEVLHSTLEINGVVDLFA
jgi:flagellar hook-length control protein FliK